MRIQTCADVKRVYIAIIRRTNAAKGIYSVGTRVVNGRMACPDGEGVDRRLRPGAWKRHDITTNR